MRPTKPFAAALVATAAICAAVPVFTQAMRVPGTKVSIAPPDGFSIAQQYPGFERPVDQASVMVTELPGAAADMIRALTPQALATRGMTVIAAQDQVINGSAARLLNVRQKTAGGHVLKWMLIAG